jgi:putative phosphoribosyl transferase
VLDQAVLKRSHLSPEDLSGIIAEENARLQSYQRKFVSADRLPRFGKSVILVDDGLATGATMEAALQSVRQAGASQIRVAVPVASNSGAVRIVPLCDEFDALLIDPEFEAVGQYYRSFAQTSDEEVAEALRRPVPPAR